MREFRNPVRLVTGRSSLRALPELLGGRDAVAVMTAGALRRGTLERVERLLGTRLRNVYTGVSPNPTIHDCLAAARELEKERPGPVLLAVGGGSAIDTAKAVTVLRAPEVSEEDFEAHLRDGRPLAEGLDLGPLIAVPTTAGTGSEVTPFATLWDEHTGAKCSLTHPGLFPDLAILDPELTVSLPREATIASALDALSHAMESIWNRNASSVSDLFAVNAISRIPDALELVLQTPGNLEVRETLQLASHFAGVAISNTRTALAHSISYPITSELGLPHGLAVSFTLPQVLRLNHSVAAERTCLVIESLGCESLERALERLDGLFQIADLAGLVRAHVPDRGALAGLKGRLIAPERAGNNLATIDEAGARQLLIEAFENLAPPRA